MCMYVYGRLDAVGGMREIVRRFRRVDHRDLLVRSASLCMNDSQDGVRKEFVLLSQSLIPLIFGGERKTLINRKEVGDGSDDSSAAWRRLLMLSIQSGLNSLSSSVQLTSFQVIDTLLTVVRNSELHWKEVFRGWDSYLWPPIVRILKNPRSSIHAISKSVQLLASCLDNLFLDESDHQNIDTSLDGIKIGEKRGEHEQYEWMDQCQCHTLFGIMTRRRQKHMKLSGNGDPSSSLWSDDRLSLMDYVPVRKLSCTEHMDTKSKEKEELTVASGSTGSFSIRESLSIDETLIELMDDLWGTWIQMMSSSSSNSVKFGSKRTSSQDEGDFVSPLKIMCYMIDMVVARKRQRDQLKKNVIDHLLPRFPLSGMHRQPNTRTSGDTDASFSMDEEAITRANFFMMCLLSEFQIIPDDFDPESFFPSVLSLKRMTNREQLWLIRMIETVQELIPSSSQSSHSWRAAGILCDHFTSLPPPSSSKMTWMKALGSKIVDWPKEQWKTFVIHLAKMLFAFGTKTPLSTQTVLTTLRHILEMIDGSSEVDYSHTIRSLGNALSPFFAARNKKTGNIKIGPFVSLPVDAQREALALLHHLRPFHPNLKIALAHTLIKLGSDVSLNSDSIIGIVEVLRIRCMSDEEKRFCEEAERKIEREMGEMEEEGEDVRRDMFTVEDFLSICLTSFVRFSPWTDHVPGYKGKECALSVASIFRQLHYDLLIRKKRYSLLRMVDAFLDLPLPVKMATKENDDDDDDDDDDERVRLGANGSSSSFMFNVLVGIFPCVIEEVEEEYSSSAPAKVKEKLSHMINRFIQILFSRMDSTVTRTLMLLCHSYDHVRDIMTQTILRHVSSVSSEDAVKCLKHIVDTSSWDLQTSPWGISFLSSLHRMSEELDARGAEIQAIRVHLRSLIPSDGSHV
eukprot:TRINITY_DN841_c0_g1_i4.p1 TRINITY_DN841_c0_g1~~TRINITY_DN841_c0_g1_i4.p1  ORF type:complete len:908 (-),score=256.41 TRINITY_DN841_c0_g1_i4:26-2749(-)